MVNRQNRLIAHPCIPQCLFQQLYVASNLEFSDEKQLEKSLNSGSQNCKLKDHCIMLDTLYTDNMGVPV